MTILFAAINRFRDVPRGVPKTQYILGTGNGGGDGMDFAVGTEVFQWSSENIPYGLKPKRIITLWVDCSAIAAGTITIQTGTQKFVFTAASQGYVILTMNAPFTMKVSATGATGLVNITAYDFNANYTGTADVAPATASGTLGSGAGEPQSEARRAHTFPFS